MYKRTINDHLTFAGQPLLRGRHKIHKYPAMLHPLLVDFLIDEYAKNDDIIFDPFCGSGVTLLQSSVKNYNSFGFDINSLSLLIAKVKTAQYDFQKLEDDFLKFKQDLESEKNVDIPKINNINYWYTNDVVNDLGKIRFVLKKNRYIYKDFFMVCFAFICRDQSLTRNGEFKRYRIKKEKIENTKNQVLEKIIKHIEVSIKNFKENNLPLKKTTPILANSEQEIDKTFTYDLVITSPPYGDSRTTVAYGQYSSFGLEWINDLNSFGKIDYKIDKEAVGKMGSIHNEIYNNEILLHTIKKIEKLNRKRSKDVIHFFNGYNNILKNIVKNLNKNGKVCCVVGNRTVGGVQIPMDQITAVFFDQLGLNFENIFVRDILNKVMPAKNSPTNKIGVTKKTMSNEYIIIFKK